MRTIITGGTGLIGRALATELASHGHEVIVLSRNPDGVKDLADGVRAVGWDAKTAQGWGELADGAHAIVNLAGENIGEGPGDNVITGTLGGRWTEERKRSIRESRTDAGKAVAAAVEAASNKPNVVVQSSAVGYYGARGDEILTEDASPGSDFLALVCFDWENSTAGVEKLGVRRPVLRSGVVLTTEGGAFTRMMLPFKLFAGGPLGSGDQWLPWIHVKDEVRAIRFLIEHESATGPFNLTAPNPLTNKEFGKALGSLMGRPSFMPAPGFAIKAVLGDMSTIVLEGQRAVPERLQELGFAFTYPEVEGALKELLGK